MANLAIKGHATRGKEIIKLLEMLGGKNDNHCCGGFINRIYFINENGYIESCDKMDHLSYFRLSLEELLEKFPYKVGDKVNDPCKGCIKTITSMEWDTYRNTVTYKLDNRIYTNIDLLKVVNDLQPYKETMEEELIPRIDFNKYSKDKYLLDLGNYEIKDENGKTYAVRKQPEYPKTYEECFELCSDVNIKVPLRPAIYRKIYKNRDLLCALSLLYYCVNAYWEIAGEQMGLGKPWEPDWSNTEEKFCIYTHRDQVARNVLVSSKVPLAFPTKEMRDEFYTNFKELIEECKELL